MVEKRACGWVVGDDGEVTGRRDCTGCMACVVISAG